MTPDAKRPAADLSAPGVKALARYLGVNRARVTQVLRQLGKE